MKCVLSKDENHVLSLVHQAFDDIALGSGESIHVADLEGVGSKKEEEIARAKDSESHWRDVPDWKLEKLSVVFSTLDCDTLRFYLPAYLDWAIRSWRTTTSHAIDSLLLFLNPRSNHRIQFFDALTVDQKVSVQKFLELLARLSVDLQPECKTALESYWNQFSCGNGIVPSTKLGQADES